jgi:DNA-binding winged helix-turn-helix (wHTH) protein/tetratricopeptide (TPR) repeat protein
MSGRSSSSSYQFGRFRLDTVERLLLYDGRPLALTPKAFAILLVLIKNSGRVVEKEQLISEVWPGAFVEESNVSQNIFTLRRVFGERDKDGLYIETVPKRGYRFVAQVSEVRDETPARTNEAQPLESVSRTDMLGAGRTLAVLPFKSLDPHLDDEYLGLGIADALITKLSNLQQLNVRSTSATRKYVGAQQDSLKAGREMQVDSLIEGSLQRSNQNLRVTVQLVNVQDGKSLWAEKFDGVFTDLFSIEDSISEQVAKALTLKLTHAEKDRLTKQHTENSEAYKNYLKGRFFWNKRTPKALQQGIKYFERAISIDHNYALAYAGLSDSYLILISLNVRLPEDCLPLAREAALKAIEIDETLAEAHCSLALAYSYSDWDLVGAEREYGRAIELNPNYATAHRWYARHLGRIERYPEALSALKRARELEPFSLIITTDIGWLLYLSRQYNQAIEQCLEVLDMDPAFHQAQAVLSMAYAEKGMFEEAITWALRVFKAKSEDPETVTFLAYFYARSGKIAEARKVIEESERERKASLSSFYMAIISIGLWKLDEALDWLERAYQERSFLLTYLKIPIFDPLRLHPKFVALLTRIGLPPSANVPD